MALKATIYKATLEIADMDRQLYRDLEVTVARHPSETDERMMVRLLTFALQVPVDDDDGALTFADDLWDADAPAMWRQDLTGRILHWIDIGQPEERRILRASSRASQVTVVSYNSSTPIWWSGVAEQLGRAKNLSVWQYPSTETAALAALAQRNLKLQVTVQDGSVWVGDGTRSVEITPRHLQSPSAPGFSG
jgi:uncharacterized protein YaeQ